MKKIVILMAFIAASATLLNAQNSPFGIGTYYPQSMLHIHQTEEDEDPVVPPIDSPSGEGNRDGVFQDNYTTTFQMTNVNTGSSSSDGFLLKQHNLDVHFSQRENGHMVFRTPGGEIILSSTGRFGYGDTVSTHRFNVHGTARFDSDVKMTQSLTVDGTASTGALSVGGALNTAGHLTVGSANQPPVGLTVHGTTTLNYGLTVGGVTTLQSALTVSSSATVNGALTVGGNAIVNGSLKIGSGFQCDAGGGLKVKYLKVTLTDWPDYVFGDNHALMPLGELEAYVNEHSHLPGVPSAEEVEADGADLGEMNKVLMEKVEELTLYIIDLQKQINELKSNK